MAEDEIAPEFNPDAQDVKNPEASLEEAGWVIEKGKPVKRESTQSGRPEYSPEQVRSMAGEAKPYTPVQQKPAPTQTQDEQPQGWPEQENIDIVRDKYESKWENSVYEATIDRTWMAEVDSFYDKDEDGTPLKVQLLNVGFVTEAGRIKSSMTPNLNRNSNFSKLCMAVFGSMPEEGQKINTKILIGKKLRIFVKLEPSKQTGDIWPRVKEFLSL